MGINNRKYSAFKDMLEGYKKDGREGYTKLQSGAFALAELEEDNPFPKQTPEYDCFYRMKQYYNTWKKGSTGSRHYAGMSLDEAKALCALKPKNPYHFDRKEAEADKAELAAEKAARTKFQQEKEQKEMELQAERILKEEERQKELAAKKEQSRIAKKQAEESAASETKRKEALLQKTIEQKRLQMKETKREEEHIEQHVEEHVEEPAQTILGVVEKPSLLSRIKDRFKR